MGTDRKAGYFCAQLVQSLYQEGGALYKGSGGELAMAKRLMDSLDAERPTGSPAAPALDERAVGRALAVLETYLAYQERMANEMRGGRKVQYCYCTDATKCGKCTQRETAIKALGIVRASLVSPPPLKTGGVKPDGLRPQIREAVEWLDFALPQVGGHPLDSVVHSEWLAAGRPYPVSDWVCREVAGKLRAILASPKTETREGLTAPKGEG